MAKRRKNLSRLTIEQWVTFLGQNSKRQTKLKPPFAKQREIIDFLFEPDPYHIKQAHLCCGRSFGKSFLAVIIATMALALSPNEIGLFLEPDWKRIHRVFLKKWYQVVHPSLFVHNKSEQLLTFFNGAKLYYGPRNITGSILAQEDGQLGQDTTFIISDEEAQRCSYRMYVNNMACIREPSDVRFYLTLSTPRVGDYQRLVTSEGHRLFIGRTADNPYNPAGFVEQMRANMSESEARRELDGEFISLEGRIWKRADTKTAWPRGNLDTRHKSFKPDEPWWLFCDLGSSTGAYAVVQRRFSDSIQDYVWVAVADYCPDYDANASNAFQKLREFYGRPECLVAGADLNKRADTDSKTVAFFAHQVWPRLPLRTCSEKIYDKQIQMNKLEYLIFGGDRHRRFTVAEHFVSHDTDSHRGIIEMLNEDEMPARNKRREGGFLPKGKEFPLCHIRDALMMGATKIMCQPRWGLEDHELTAYDEIA